MRVTCLACGQANRVPADRLGASPKCGTCGEQLADGRVREIDAAILARAAQDDLPLVVDFWAAWCGPCRMMAPEFAKAAATLAPGVRLAKLDTEAHPEVSARFGIRGIPLLIAFRGGREVGRQAGAQLATGIVAWVRGLLRATRDAPKHLKRVWSKNRVLLSKSEYLFQEEARCQPTKEHRGAPETVEVTFLIDAADYGAATSFGIRLDVEGKGKTLARPPSDEEPERFIFTSPGTQVTLHEPRVGRGDHFQYQWLHPSADAAGRWMSFNTYVGRIAGGPRD